MQLLKLTNISKNLGGRAILNNLDLELNKGDMKVLIGPSGGGKSTFLQCMNLLIEPDEGQIAFKGENINFHDTKQVCKFRQKVGMIFQDFNLFDHLNALDNIILALKKVRNFSHDDAQTRAFVELQRVGLEAKAMLYPAQLSGGQKQRVAIARALAMDPEMLLLDEPTSALDPELVGEVLQVIKDLVKQGMPMIMATHQMDFAKSLATEILFMEKGFIIEQGTAAELLNNENSRTKAFCSLVH